MKNALSKEWTTRHPPLVAGLVVIGSSVGPHAGWWVDEGGPEIGYIERNISCESVGREPRLLEVVLLHSPLHYLPRTTKSLGAKC